MTAASRPPSEDAGPPIVGRIRLKRAVASEPVLVSAGIGRAADRGEYPCTMNPQGAVCAVLGDGSLLGVTPDEFAFIAITAPLTNRQRGAWLMHDIDLDQLASVSGGSETPSAWQIFDVSGKSVGAYDDERYAKHVLLDLNAVGVGRPYHIVPLFRALPDTGAAPPSGAEGICVVCYHPLAAPAEPAAWALCVDGQVVLVSVYRNRVDRELARLESLGVRNQYTVEPLYRASRVSGDSDETAPSDTARLDWLESTVDDGGNRDVDTTLWSDHEVPENASPLFAISGYWAGNQRGKNLREAIDAGMRAARSSTPSPGSEDKS